jgi:CxxC-x17-CxxC domain-containing protein
MRENRGGGGFRRDDRPQEKHKAICAECGKECVVPFEPKGDRPVYCQECYRARRSKDRY